MPKIENPHLIQIELSGGRAKIGQNEYELSMDKWHSRRAGAFAQLRKTGGMPKELLDLVEQFEEQTPVQLFVYRPSKKAELRLGVKVAVSHTKEEKAKKLAEITSAYDRIHDDDQNEEMTASEALAFMLRMDLRNLKHSEKSRKAAPVRTLNLVPRSLIAEIAMDLLQSCETWGYPPGPLLSGLIRELLNLEHDRQGMRREGEKLESAAGIIAQAPAVGTRELANALRVNASTISRWRRNPEFRKLVAQKAEALKIQVGSEDSTLSAKKDDLTQKELSLLLSIAASLCTKNENTD